MQTTEVELREIRDLILSLDKKVEAQDKRNEVNATRTEEQLKALQQQMTALDASLNKRIDSLDASLNKRIDSLEKSSDGQETRFWGLIGILATFSLGILAKLAFFPGIKS